MTFASILRMRNFKALIYGVTAIFGLAVMASTGRVSASSNSLVVYQVQTGSTGSASQEFVSIYNNSSGPVDVTGWCVMYSSASDATQSQLGCLSPPNNQTRLWVDSHKSVLLASNEFTQANPDAQIDLIFKAGMSATSGHIKLLNPQKELIDSVGWGAASKPEGSSAVAHPVGKILQRLNLNEQELRDTDSNSTDFHHVSLSVPPSGVYEEFIESDLESVALVISEILPDAIGADAGKEFVEIYNPSEQPVNLGNYVLQSGPTYAKSYRLPDLVIEPLSYLALSDDQTKLSLPNTSGSVRLLDPAGNILSTTGTYADLGEGVSWAFDGSWRATYQSTPGSENIILTAKPCPDGQVRSEESGRCRNISSAKSSAPTPCRSDQVRNPETNRCRKISSLVSGLTPCKPGQIRSPETNRCRSATSKSNAKAPCKAGQTRNPETGRCKKIAVAAGAKPCPAGQARNKQTNRCRKIPPPINKNEVKDIQSPLVTGNFKWWFAGFSALGSVGYGFYEWRREAFRFAARWSWRSLIR